jgi:hypothetical protein
MMMRMQELSDYVPVATAKAHVTEAELMEQKLARKRHEEFERRQRIFDAKRRTIGIDKAALDTQVEEKKMMEEVEKERESHFDHQSLYFNNVIKMQEIEARAKRSELERHMKEYGLLHMNKFERDTADIEYPPKYAPPLMEGAEPCGASSAQVFSGEDSSRDVRQKAQQLQLRDWYEQQVFEKAYNKAMLERANDTTTAQNDLAATNLLEVEKAEAEMRAELERSRQEYNLMLQSGKERLQQEDKEIAEMQKQEDVRNNLGSRFLSETTPYVSPYNGKVLHAEYKGENGPDALDEMVRVREEQIAHKEMMGTLKKQEEREALRQQREVNRALVAGQRAQQRTKREMMEAVVRENMAIAAAKKKKEAYAQHSMYTNECSADFWAQFGTSTR